MVATPARRDSSPHGGDPPHAGVGALAYRAVAETFEPARHPACSERPPSPTGMTVDSMAEFKPRRIIHSRPQSVHRGCGWFFLAENKSPARLVVAGQGRLSRGLRLNAFTRAIGLNVSRFCQMSSHAIPNANRIPNRTFVPTIFIEMVLFPANEDQLGVSITFLMTFHLVLAYAIQIVRARRLLVRTERRCQRRRKSILDRTTSVDRPRARRIDDSDALRCRGAGERAACPVKLHARDAGCRAAVQ